MRCSLLTLFVLAAFPTLAAAQTPGEIVEYYHLDALGSVRVVTNQAGAVVRRHDFKPFGEEINVTFPNPDRKLFTGQERDSETALDYFGARYYRADLGRFTTVDPAGVNPLKLVNPQRFNRYAYANNNPLLFVDYDGRDAAYVNFSTMANGFGHAGVLSIHADGTATYSRSGPATPGNAKDVNQVNTTSDLPRIQFADDGSPTQDSYLQIAKAVAAFETQISHAAVDPSTVSIAYFKTSPAETAALDAYIAKNTAASRSGTLPDYHVLVNSCRHYAVNGLVAGGVLTRQAPGWLSIYPNGVWSTLFKAASMPKGKVTTSYTWCMPGSAGCQAK